MAYKLKAFHILKNGNDLLITGSGLKEIPDSLKDHVDNQWVFNSDMQLSSKAFNSSKEIFGGKIFHRQINQFLQIGLKIKIF